MEYIKKGMTYQAYKELVDDLLLQGKTTSGHEDTEMLDYTRLNQQRTKRIDKTIKLNDELVALLNDLHENWIWLVITEGWCGDAAQCLPAIAAIAQQSDKIDLKLILRDENLPLMDRYLTNGGRAIPKLICFRKSDGKELGTWGPRPALAQKIFIALKNDPGNNSDDPYEKLHEWYAKDRSKTILSEFELLIKTWQSVSAKE